MQSLSPWPSHTQCVDSPVVCTPSLLSCCKTNIQGHNYYNWNISTKLWIQSTTLHLVQYSTLFLNILWFKDLLDKFYFCDWWIPEPQNIQRDQVKQCLDSVFSLHLPVNSHVSWFLVLSTLNTINRQITLFLHKCTLFQCYWQTNK